MPRGIPKAGYRKRRRADGSLSVPKRPVHWTQDDHDAHGSDVIAPASENETDAQIDARINERFVILKAMIQQSLDGEAPAVIVSGPPGLGKSFEIEQAIARWDPTNIKHTVIKGHVKATGLFKTLWHYKERGNVIVFDDADTIFNDETSLNMLKAVCDSTETRRVSYLTEYQFIDEVTSMPIPKTFTFEGTIIFITNHDFDAQIERGSKNSVHMQALMSRAHYIDMMMKGSRDYIIRIKQVLRTGFLRRKGITQTMEDEILEFMQKNSKQMRELSIRSIIKLAMVRRTQPNWQSFASNTFFRR
jgi:hypothetical protein